MSLSSYFFTPKDIWHVSKRGFQIATRKGVFGIVLLFCAIFFLWLTSTLSFENMAFLLFMFAIFYWNWDSRVSIGLALACLITIPLLLIGYNQDIIPMGDVAAERVAVWAYYFLAIGVFKQIMEYVREGKRKEISEAGLEKNPEQSQNRVVPMQEVRVKRIAPPKRIVRRRRIV